MEGVDGHVVLVAKACQFGTAKLNTCLEALLRSALPLVTSLIVVRLSYED